jgi:hypothetical protein
VIQFSPQRTQSTQRRSNLISNAFLCNLSVLCGK